MDTVVADASRAVLLAVEGVAVTRLAETGELFKVDLDQIAVKSVRSAGQGLRLQVAQPPEPVVVEGPGNGGVSGGQQTVDVAGDESVDASVRWCAADAWHRATAGEYGHRCVNPPFNLIEAVQAGPPERCGQPLLGQRGLIHTSPASSARERGSSKC